MVTGKTRRHLPPPQRAKSTRPPSIVNSPLLGPAQGSCSSPDFPRTGRMSALGLLGRHFALFIGILVFLDILHGIAALDLSCTKLTFIVSLIGHDFGAICSRVSGCSRKLQFQRAANRTRLPLTCTYQPSLRARPSVPSMFRPAAWCLLFSKGL